MSMTKTTSWNNIKKWNSIEDGIGGGGWDYKNDSVTWNTNYGPEEWQDRCTLIPKLKIRRYIVMVTRKRSFLLYFPFFD